MVGPSQLLYAEDQFQFFCSPLLLSSGKTLCNIEQFGQYPLQVNGFNNLYECLEGAMVEKEIESLHSDHSIPSGREVNLTSHARAESVLVTLRVWARSHSYSVFTYLCRDGSRNYRQYWPLNCRGLNSTLSSVVLRRSTKSWSSHRSSTWTGKIQNTRRLGRKTFG